MPFYEYQCGACGSHHEALQKVSDAPLKKCPSCGKARLRKLMSAPVFRLKGSGWYETDFKSDQEAKRNLAVEKDEPKSEAAKPDTAKTETAKAETPKTDAAKPDAPKKDAAKPAASKPRARSATRSSRAAPRKRKR
jgi:putative FmdB family regulatory protein